MNYDSLAIHKPHEILFSRMIGEEIDLTQVFAHRPEEFAVEPNATWKPPSTVQADLHFSPVSDSAKREFWPSFALMCPLDAFSKTPIREQLDAMYSTSYNCIKDGHSPWFRFLYEKYKALSQQISDLDKLFEPPFRFVPRGQFEKVDLKRILSEPPDETHIYLALEKGSHAHYNFLRIHSSLWYHQQRKRYFWFERRLPDSVFKEDVLPWFRATIQRIPKRCRPNNVELWEEKLMRSQEDLSPPTVPINADWSHRRRMVIVFGAVQKVGYRRLFHIRRNDTFQLIRIGEVLQMRCNLDDFGGNFANDIWTFFLVTADAQAAQKIENQILWGGRIHFGLDQDILGIVSLRDKAIHSINVPEQQMRELCAVGNAPLNLITRPTQKHKVYFIQAGTNTEVMEKDEPV